MFFHSIVSCFLLRRKESRSVLSLHSIPTSSLAVQPSSGALDAQAVFLVFLSIWIGFMLLVAECLAIARWCEPFFEPVPRWGHVVSRIEKLNEPFSQEVVHLLVRRHIVAVVMAWQTYAFLSAFLAFALLLIIARTYGQQSLAFQAFAYAFIARVAALVFHIPLLYRWDERKWMKELHDANPACARCYKHAMHSHAVE